MGVLLLLSGPVVLNERPVRRHRFEPTDVRSLVMNVADPVAHYSSSHEDFCNKCDFELYATMLPKLPACRGGVFIIAGMNKGDLADLVLKTCQHSTVHGFEVQNSVYEHLLRKYALQSDRVVLNFMGLADSVHNMPVSGGAETAGIRFKWDRANETWNGVSTVTTIGLAEYVKIANLQDIALMVLIDVEGHEPKVLQGMNLYRYRSTFPIFAFELGGTWMDDRNPSTWNQSGTAQFLTDLGYDLFLIGRRGLMEVSARFFAHSRVHNEGTGFFVQGNVLAVLQ